MKNKKFNDILLKYNLISEADFVRDEEESELPDAADDSNETDVDAPDVDAEDTPEVDEEPEENYSQREINILDTAAKLHFNNPNVDLETRNEIEELQRDEDYDALFKRLISIADGYEI